MGGLDEGGCRPTCCCAKRKNVSGLGNFESIMVIVVFLDSSGDKVCFNRGGGRYVIFLQTENKINNTMTGSHFVGKFLLACWPALLLKADDVLLMKGSLSVSAYR